MRYLTEEYWSNINSQDKKNKGICFENLVFELLKAEYGIESFQKTKGSWDGNKDFYYYSKLNKIWAECKNYSSSIDLKVLASTLIMAQISEINTVLFYSVSSINLNAKAKLLINAEKNGEAVYFYDDNILEQKIFENWDKIPSEKYFPDFTFDEQFLNNSKNNYNTKCLLFGNPLDAGTSVEEYEIKYLTLFKMFEMNICIFNMQNESRTFSVFFKNAEKIKTEFDVYPNRISNSQYIVNLDAYQAKIIHFWFIPIKNKCHIPVPYVNNKLVKLPKNVMFKELEAKQVGLSRLIGKNFENYIEDFEINVLSKFDETKIGLLYGNSGTGKSRLYQECLNIAKIKNYEIIDFSNLTTIADTLSLNDFIKKIIISIYHVPIETLKELIEKITLNDMEDGFLEKKLEFHMLAELFNSGENLEEWINKYFDIITLKLSTKNYILSIDNLQFCDDKIINLIDRLCQKLILLTQCKTKFLFVLNVDYIRRNSPADLFLGKYTAKKQIVCSKQVIGFANSNECFEFLQETFSISNVLSKEEIATISDNLNKNPFYLEQMIYWLREKGVLEECKNEYIVMDSFRLKSLIKNIPTNVMTILNERWEYYKQHNVINLKKVIVLISAINLYKQLDKKELDILEISESLINELEKFDFLTLKEEHSTYTVSFRHDLISKFFSRMDNNLSRHIIEYENKKGICLKPSVFRGNFGKLYMDKRVLDNEQFSTIIDSKVDSKLANEFYLLAYNTYWENFNRNFQANAQLCINNLFNIVVRIHDILGNNVMEKCVDTLFYYMNDVPDAYNYLEYGKLLIYISEAYDSMGRYHDAVDLIMHYKKKCYKANDISNYTIEQKQLLSYMYNRLHVYYRHQVSNPLSNHQIMEYLRKSQKIADIINYKVMQYVNYSDEGYLYYDLPANDQDSVNTKSKWNKACEIYEQGGAEEKELNYMRKKAQLALLNGNFSESVNIIKAGLELIDISDNSYQQTFFKWWFYHALAEGYLLCFKEDNISDLESALERAQFYSELIKSNKKFYYLELQAIFLYYKGRKEDAKLLNMEALDLVKNSNYENKKSSMTKQLLQNATIFCSMNSTSNVKLYSQIQTNDGLFNLPCL